jgi:hypothetical protein
MDLQDIKLAHAIARHSDMPAVIDIEFNLINC